MRKVERGYVEGDVVRVHFVSLPTEDRVLTQRDAEELNDGENPYYPWRVTRFELLPEEGEE